MATWKKLVISGSSNLQLNNNPATGGAGYLTSVTAQHAFVTASFGAIDIEANSSQGVLNFTETTGGSTGLQITADTNTNTLDFGLANVPNSSLTNDGITIAGVDTDLGGFITADTIAGQIGSGIITNAQLANDTITIGSTGIALGSSATTIVGLTSVTSTDFVGNLAGDVTGTITPSSILANGVRATTQTQGDNSTLVATTEYVDASATAADLDLSGDGGTSTSIDLDSQTLAFSGADGIEVSSSAQAITVSIADAKITNAKLVNDGITIAGVDTSLGGTITADTIAGAIGNGIITNAQLANSTISGIGLGNNLSSLLVDNSSIEFYNGPALYNGSTQTNLQVKANGITNTMLQGSIANAKLTNSSITIGNATVALGGTTTLAATKFNSGSFSGSFQGDGSLLTGIASTLNFTDGSNPQGLDLKTDTLVIAGTANEVDVNTTINDQITIGLPDDVTIGNDLVVTNDLTVTRDAVFSRNITVLGTASFQNTEDLDVKDRFIRLASGSNAAGDGGIVIQQTNNLDGEVFGFDSVAGTEGRWGVSGSFDASQNAFVPDAYMAEILEDVFDTPGAIAAAVPSRYNENGNIYVDTSKTLATDANIWIYA